MFLSGNRRIFVTGTDTGVGKTFISCALIYKLKEMGYPVAVMKPFESGCELIDGELIPDDAQKLVMASGANIKNNQLLNAVCPYRMKAPLAPAVAAAKEGIEVDENHLKDMADKLQRSEGINSVLLIEGAGGLLVPAYNDKNMADLALLLGADILLVSRSRLGTINHTLLTLEAARSRNLEVLSVILNETESNVVDDPSVKLNKESIENYGKCSVDGQIPFIENEVKNHSQLEIFSTDNLRKDFENTIKKTADHISLTFL